MRSHVAVYRAPENANGCQFARYALHAPPTRQQQQQQHQSLQPHALWNAAQPTAPAACYNLHAQLQHHSIYHASAGAGAGAGAAAMPQPQQLLVNQQRINECAGIPLISNACSHLAPSQRHRLLRKSGKPWPAAGAQSMSQLAVHAQGQPLLQNIKQHHVPLHHQQLSPQSWPAHAASYQLPMRVNNFQLTDKSRMLRYQNSAPAVLSAQEQQKTLNSIGNHNNNSSNGSSSSSSSSSSSGSNSHCSGQEQTSSVTDTCLPRIIKPRKRRKKDRKPANGVLLKMDADLQPKLQQQHQQQQQQQPQQQQQYQHQPQHHPHHHPHPQSVHPHHHHHHQALNAANYAQLLPMARDRGMQHDHSHGVCFCRDCDPLRSLWDYPLRRSLSDASSSGQGASNSSNSSTSTHSDSSCASSICSQTMANNFDETEHFAPITGDSSRAEIVGVIGSQRSSHAHTASTSATATATAPPTASATTTAPALYLSDSSDSGYGDILSGMNIANDLFASCFGTAAAANAAETLLDESINEISRKLIETCAVNEPPPNEADASNGCGSGGGLGCRGEGIAGDSDSCSASASDSGLDSAGSYNSEALVFNFEHLNLMDTNFVTPTALDFLLDCNNNKRSESSSRSSSSNDNGNGNAKSDNNNNSSSSSDNITSQMTAGKGGDSNAATPTTLILGTVGKLKPAFSTIS
ncbi:centrosomal and chromosomal factor isoform X2 [Drosophila navojoa]|uniref:centrosomal and chromosomal factor isoform X2 n=1 Tax=Drosophila navojoa TaxID=7232 RepID=UPI0011BEB64B|nr:centrosomal and chromosomal factor isoform X2 [Drosophila navojoa]